MVHLPEIMFTTPKQIWFVFASGSESLQLKAILHEKKLD